MRFAYAKVLIRSSHSPTDSNLPSSSVSKRLENLNTEVLQDARDQFVDLEIVGKKAFTLCSTVYSTSGPQSLAKALVEAEALEDLLPALEWPS